MKQKSAFLILLITSMVPVILFAENLRETPVVKIVRENKDAVVNISTERILLLRENPAWGPYGNDFDDFFGQFYSAMRPTRALKLKSVGSGVIVDKSGLVVTNAHVVNMATNVYAILNDGRELKGDVVYESADDDLAIVKINAPADLKELKLGATEDLMIGETAIAIGDPLGLENSVSVGVISGAERNLSASNGQVVFEGLIQTDTPINPGNSGGALLNLNGELIGINVAVVQNSQSIGFAIPVEKVKKVIEAYHNNKAAVIKHKWRAIPLGVKNTSAGPAGGSMQNKLLGHNSLKLSMEKDNDNYYIKLDVSDIDKNKIDIEITPGNIKISGQRAEVTEEKTPEGYVSMKRYGSFSRVIPIPADADPKLVRTEISGNTLIITLPKKA